jgi:hypothetical protein
MVEVSHDTTQRKVIEKHATVKSVLTSGIVSSTGQKFVNPAQVAGLLTRKEDASWQLRAPPSHKGID